MKSTDSSVRNNNFQTCCAYHILVHLKLLPGFLRLKQKIRLAQETHSEASKFEQDPLPYIND